MTVAGILTPLEQVLQAGLEWLHGTLELPWAWAVVGLTIVVRMLLVPLTVRQIHSMQNLQRHMPQLKEIQRKYKGDRQRMNEEVMRFYRENRVTPASSCLPIVFQIPIFIALYFVLRDFEDEIYPNFPQSDLGWLSFVPDITDAIDAHWSGYVLLALYVVSQMASTLLMPTTLQRSQRILMLVLPLIFVFFIVNPPVGAEFPVGLLLYWVTTNLWTVGQGLVTRELAQKAPATPAKRSSRTPPQAERGDGAAAAPPEPKAPAPAGAPRRVKRKKRTRR